MEDGYVTIKPLVRPVTPLAAAVQPLSRPLRQAGVVAGLSTGAHVMARDQLRLGMVAKPVSIALATAASGRAASLLFRDQPDKPKHAMACAAITGTVRHVTGSRALGVAAGVAVGIAKEFYDGSKFNPNGSRDFSLRGDLGADLLGIAFGAVL